MLCQRYANPAFLIDNMISTGQFADWCYSVAMKHQQDRIESWKWDIWLHKVYDKTWTEFNDIAEQPEVDSKQVAQQLKDINEMATNTCWDV